MKRFFRETTSCLVFLLLLTQQVAIAATIPALHSPTGLSLSELKVTGNEFIVIQNNTGQAITDLSTYWLYVFNKTDPSVAGTSSSGQQ